ncbi:MAG: hypothetical protein R6U37_05655 [Dehalococcoidia bacterium]
MNSKGILLGILVLLLFCLPACVGDDNEKTPAESPGATVSPTPTPAPSPTPFISIPQQVILEKGQYWKFNYFIGEEEFGSNEYVVTAVPQAAGTMTYIIESNLTMLKTEPWWGKGFTSDATLKINSFGNPINYNSAEQIGSG